VNKIFKYWYVGVFVIIAFIGIGIYALSTNPALVDWLADPDRKNFVIEVTGNAGITYSETCSSESKFSSSNDYTAKVKVPHTYDYYDHIVKCTFQKNGGAGTLRVTMYREGALVFSEATTDPNGSISVEGK